MKTVAFLCLLFLSFLVVSFSQIYAVSHTTEELDTASEWINGCLGPDAPVPPFSFVYGGRNSAELLKNWKVVRKSKALDKNRTQLNILFSDPLTGLVIDCEAIKWKDYPAVEWVLYFQNTSQSDTLIIEDIQALDITVQQKLQTNYTLYHGYGADNKLHDFGLRTDIILPKSTTKIGSQGMSSIQSLPFFNLQLNKNGIIGAVGWSGNWSAQFQCGEKNELNLRAGMDSTHLLLHADERIRTPRIALLFWKGDRFRGHNIWRRFMLDYYSPHLEGKPVVVPLAAANWGAMSSADQTQRVKWYVDKKLPIDCFWIDAGWSGKTGPIDSWVANAATRIANSELYPNGIREVSDFTRKYGLKFLLWMWPNRAVKGVEIGAEHPEWVLPNEAVDHGVAEVNEWMKKYYSNIISEYGLDIFRQDGNPVYTADESPDRQGINQIRHFEGFYEFWDYLLQNHPGLMIDNCSGGGRKIDLETSKRSVSMWRSDFQVPQPFDPIGMQSQTYGLSFWVPLSSGCTRLTDDYTFRSAYSPGIVLGFTDAPNYADIFDYDAGRKHMNQYISGRPYFYGDYYPLTDYSIANNTWMAWQFDRPDLHEGLVQAFRREECIYESAQLKLHALIPKANYTVKNFDIPDIIQLTGRQLMEEGLQIKIKEQPGTSVIVYKRSP